MNRKVLNRPMFARMRDGGLQKILYAKDGTDVYRPQEENKKTWGKFFDFLNPIGGEYNIIGKNKEGKFYSQALEDITGADAATEKIKKLDPERKPGLFEYLPFYSGLGDWNFRPEVVRPGEQEPEVKDKWREEQDKRDNEDKQQAPEKVKEITTDIKETIKSGGLDESIKEKITLFEKYLGKDKKKRQKNAVFQMMVETGLGMVADKEGGNVLEVAARSAKDPVKKLNEVGNELLDRAEKIKEAGIESGISSYEKEKEREVDLAGQQVDIKIQELKNTAAKKTQSEFIMDSVANILADENARNAFTLGAYDKNGDRIPGAGSDREIVTEQIRDIWGSAHPVTVPAGEAGFAVYETLPSGTWFLDEETGRVSKKE